MVANIETAHLRQQKQRKAYGGARGIGSVEAMAVLNPALASVSGMSAALWLCAGVPRQMLMSVGMAITELPATFVPHRQVGLGLIPVNWVTLRETLRNPS